ncbi:pyridoxamine 5'-phosphate oxidase family protein [Arcobacter lanthieri]|uniref:pyridoxamine 5'-phosphate oxidase family protein n=2 Tax=Campylobacterales TaxID=213849 RepID=UPI000DEBF385|nr:MULTISPECIES: pyridoxamine 5'-phosphate oxidase family protein [Arcobacteraceae]MBL3519024.1 pyridoxamine 5'-phosphate oxidase family protein [Aliarcobacter lanthieri]RBQ26828.1 antibiotic resistance protein [Arcobacter sp. CECT 9188]
MRRAEFDVKDENSINEVLEACEYGTLSLINNGKPYCIALNFVYFQGSIYFHGSNEGKKIDTIKENPNGSFLVVQPYSTIPSYFFDTVAACPATQFFASVLLEGMLSFVDNGDEKAKVLNALMKKLQKDGGYEEIAYDKAMYTKMLDKVTVIRLKPQNISCKIKVGQNLNDEKRDKLTQKLENRASNIDMHTIKQMKFYNKQ